MHHRQLSGCHLVLAASGASSMAPRCLNGFVCSCFPRFVTWLTACVSFSPSLASSVVPLSYVLFTKAVTHYDASLSSWCMFQCDYCAPIAHAAGRTVSCCALQPTNICARHTHTLLRQLQQASPVAYYGMHAAMSCCYAYGICYYRALSSSGAHCLIEACTRSSSRMHYGRVA